MSKDTTSVVPMRASVFMNPSRRRMISLPKMIRGGLKPGWNKI
jgi:hypothetical protein